MRVKEVIASALTLLGRAELASASLDTQSADREARELIETLLYCYNAVEDELAHKYIPLIAIEDLYSANSCFDLSALRHRPIKIKRVTSEGKSVKFELGSARIYAAPQVVTVEYEYAPARKGLDDGSEYGDGVSGYLMALGIAAEYCAVNGETEAAKLWESKYRARLESKKSELKANNRIPSRSWT